MAAPGTALTAQEQALLELVHWLARVQQYSASHPACAQLGEKTHAAFLRALQAEAPLSYGITKDGLAIGKEGMAQHPVVKGRLAAHLHERGVLVLRVGYGVTIAELTSLIELLTLPAQHIFDRGGLVRLAMEKAVLRIQIEELQHDITAEEREAIRRRKELKKFFEEVLRQLLAEGGLAFALGAKLLELLDHPDIAIMILEEDPVGIAEAFAGLCVMVREEEQRSNLELLPKLLVVLQGLSPVSHDRIVLGFPPLVGEFRAALAWCLDAPTEDELARIAFPAFRRNPQSLDIVLYALSVAIPHDGRRKGLLRRLALYLHDLPLDDVVGTELLNALAKPVDDFESYRKERDVLWMHAVRALATRTMFSAPLSIPPPESTPEGDPPPKPAFVAERTMTELVKMASRTKRFDRFCARLPSAAGALAKEGHSDAVAGILHALRDIKRPEWKELAITTMREIAAPEVVARLITDLDASSPNVEGEELERLVGTVKLLVALAPNPIFERLDLSENRKMRRMLLEALASGGPSLLQSARARLQSQQWYIVRNAVVLVPRLGGVPKDLTAVARHPNEKVRLEVARSLRIMQPDEAMQEIVAQYIVDPVAEVRSYSMPLVRGEYANQKALLLFEAVAADDKQPDEVRKRIVDALARSASDVAALALFNLLQPKGILDTGAVREHAALALRHSRAPRASAYFDEGLRSSAWRVRKACEKAAAGG
ncbi:MAG TPA: hypothetical protein VIF62_03745 [Labilithrix sp.]